MIMTVVKYKNMSMERLYIRALNKVGESKHCLDEKIRNSLIFLSFFIFALIFSLNPRYVHDGKRMLLLSLVLIVLILSCTDRKVLPVRWNKTVMIPFELFAAGMIVIRMIHPVGDGYMIYALDILLLFPALYTVLINRNDHEHIYELLSVAVIMSGVISFICGIIHAGRGEYWIFPERAFGITGNPNYYGMLGLAVLIAGLYLMVNRLEDMRIVIPTTMCMGVGASMMIRSVARAALLSAIICFGILLIYACRTYKDRKKIFSLTPLAILLLTVLMSLSFIVGIRIQNGDSYIPETGWIIATAFAEDEITEISAEEEEQKSVLEQRLSPDTDLDTFTSGRLSIWKIYIEHLNMTGNDFDAVKKEYFSGLDASRAHNNFLEYAFRFGVPVGILYAVFFIAVMARAVYLLFWSKCLRPSYLWVVMVTASYGVYAMVEISTLPFTRYIPCLFFVSMAPLAGISVKE